jgi:putative transposase
MNVGNYTPQEECPSIKPQKGTKNVEIKVQSNDIPSEIEVCLKQKATFLKCQETKKRKRSEREEKTKAGARVRTFKVRLYPTGAQKKTLRVFFGHARYTYNTVVNAVKKCREEGMAARRAELKATLVTHPSEPWLKDVPVYPREGALDDFFIAQKSANTNKQRGNIKEYNFKYRSKRDPRESIRIRGDRGSSFKYGIHDDDEKGNKRSRSKNGSSYAVFNPDELGKQGILMKTTSHVKRLGDKPTSDMRLVRTRDDKYWLCVTVQRDEIVSKDFLGDARAPIVALDPGTRTFVTAYDTEGNVHDIGITKDVARMHRLEHAIDENKRKIQAIQKMEKEKRPKTPGSTPVSPKHAQPTTKERKLENKNLCLFRRMKNMTDDIHWKVIRFLCNQYKIILLPKFNAKNCMVKIMSKKTSRTTMQWSHCRFMDRLKWKAGHLDTTVLVNGEAYTSITCGRCGEEHKTLGTKKIFICPKCEWTADRDANGARNILLRSIGNATVSKDGLEALVMEVDEVHERLEFETNKESNVIDLA